MLCIGLDPEMSKLPAHLRDHPDAIFEFNKQIIDATRDLCVAYKPNLAFYEALGPEGWEILARTREYIGTDHLTIADAKRGDIGNTSRLYAQAFFEKLGFDAITVAPYMGEDSITPFLEFQDKWVILLALTSNTGSADFQLTEQSETRERFFEKVLRRAQKWGSIHNLMFVVGATHPDAFKIVRNIVPDNFLLVPGVGAQGGDLKTIIQKGSTSEGGLLINASRSILYASSGENFAEEARTEAAKLQVIMAHMLN